MKNFKKRKIKSSKDDEKSTSEIGFNKEKILKMTRLCLIASKCDNLKPNNISDDGIIKPDYDSIKEEMKRIRKESDQESEIFDIIESKDNKMIPIFDKVENNVIIKVIKKVINKVTNSNLSVDKDEKCVGLVYYEDKTKEVFIVYRGTDLSRMHEIGLDTEFSKQPIENTGLNLLTKGKVHKGFLKGFNELYDNLFEILNSENLITINFNNMETDKNDVTTIDSDPEIECINKNMKLYIVGHSLGATKATNTTVKLAELGFNNIYTLLIASPKNFSFSASEQYDKNWGERTLRINNSNDSIRNVPPHTVGFHNVGYRLTILDKSSGYVEPHKLYTYYKEIKELPEQDFIAARTQDCAIYSRKENHSPEKARGTTSVSFCKVKKLKKMIRYSTIECNTDMVDDSRKELLSRDIKPYDNKENNKPSPILESTEAHSLSKNLRIK